MDRVEGDPMPSEAEFVSTLDTRRQAGKVPRLEATEDELSLPEVGPAARPSGAAARHDRQLSAARAGALTRP